MINIKTNVDIEIDEEVFNACIKAGLDVPKFCADYLTHYFDEPKIVIGDPKIGELARKRNQLEKQKELNQQNIIIRK